MTFNWMAEQQALSFIGSILLHARSNEFFVRFIFVPKKFLPLSIGIYSVHFFPISMTQDPMI